MNRNLDLLLGREHHFPHDLYFKKQKEIVDHIRVWYHLEIVHRGLGADEFYPRSRYYIQGT